MNDHYKTLGVSPDSEDIVIRAAYRALMQKYHPDRFTGSKEEAEQRAKAINAAYEVLGDPDKRAQYDKSQADDPIPDLLKLCDEDPEAGLKILDSMPEELQKNDLLQAARLIALHHRAFRSLTEFPKLLFLVEDEVLKGQLTAHTREYAQQAFEQAVALIRSDEEYALENPTLGRLVDDALFLYERLNPGGVQTVLGWTKIKYFGTTRFGLVSERTEQNSAVGKIIDVRVRPPEVIRSAIIASSHAESNGTWKCVLFVMRNDFNLFPTYGDAEILGTLSIDENGVWKFKAHSDQSEQRPSTPVAFSENIGVEPKTAYQGDAQPQEKQNLLPILLIGLAIGLVGIWIFAGRNTSRNGSRPAQVEQVASVQVYTVRAVIARSAPSTTSQVIYKLSRGESIQGIWVSGASGAEQWLKITSGTYQGNYVSGVNLSSEARPEVIQYIDRDRTLAQQAELLGAPSSNGPRIDTLSAGLVVRVAAEVTGGWVEILRKSGGVGYVELSAFQQNNRSEFSSSSPDREGHIAQEVPQNRSGHSGPEADAASTDNCGSARNWVDITVCDTPSLARIDSTIAAAYRHLLAAHPDNRAELQKGQMIWLGSREQCEAGGGVACLYRVYNERASALNELIGRAAEKIAAGSSTIYRCVQVDKETNHATFYIDFQSGTVRSPDFGTVGELVGARITEATVSWQATQKRNWGFGGYNHQSMTLDRATGRLVDDYGSGTTIFRCQVTQ